MKVRVKSQLFVLALMFAAPVCYSSDVHLSPSNNNINDNINSKNLKSAKTISELSSINWSELLPNNFMEIFLVVTFGIHTKWHYELLKLVEEVEEKAEELDEKINEFLFRSPSEKKSPQSRNSWSSV